MYVCIYIHDMFDTPRHAGILYHHFVSLVRSPYFWLAGGASACRGNLGSERFNTEVRTSTMSATSCERAKKKRGGAT